MDGIKPETRFMVIAISIGAFVGAIASVPALFIAMVSAGGGHGHYVEARALFPVPMLLTLVENKIGPIAIGIGLLQFPFYGGLLARAIVRRGYLPIAAAALVHLVAAIACFAGALNRFIA